jgi:hypothetical protein
MIDKARLTLITAVLVAGFASPVFADCLESGAAESCGGGGSYGWAGPGLHHYYNVSPGYGVSARYEASGRM